MVAMGLSIRSRGRIFERITQQSRLCWEQTPVVGTLQSLTPFVCSNAFLAYFALEPLKVLDLVGCSILFIPCLSLLSNTVLYVLRGSSGNLTFRRSLRAGLGFWVIIDE